MRKYLIILLLLGLIASIVSANAIFRGIRETTCDADCIASLPKDAKAIAIVLGMGPAPGSPILDRADLALQLYRAGVVGGFVVSGGRGRDEIESEAATLRRALEAGGVAPASIFDEAQSTSTVENMRNTRELLGTLGLLGSPLYVVTHSGHGYRAGQIAAHFQLSARVLTTPGTRMKGIPFRMFREIAAVWLWWLKDAK